MEIGEEIKILLPESIAKPMIYKLHWNPRSCHSNKRQIKAKIAENYHLINADAVIESIIQDCLICSMSIVPRKPKHNYYQERIPEGSRSKLYIDLFQGMQKTSSSFKFCICAVDRLSSYVIASPTKSKGEEDIKIFLSNLITTFGSPDIIVGSRVGHFTF